MNTTVEELGGDRIRLTIEVPAHDIQHAVAHATSDLSASVRVPGFRQGKVPPQVLLAKIGKQRIYSEAVDSHIGNWFWSAARNTRMRPVESPAYDYELPTAEDADWTFTAEFGVQPLPEPADWKTLEAPKLDVDVPEEFVDRQLEALQGTSSDLSAVDGRIARTGDVAVVDIVSDSGQGQRAYVVELGQDRLVEELERGIRELEPGGSTEVSWDLGQGTGTRGAKVTLTELYERVLPPIDDELAKSLTEFDTLDELKTDVERRIREQLEEEAEARFRSAAVDELVKASKVEPARLVVEVRTRELINAFLHQLESRGIDPGAYLQATGLTGADLEQRLRAEAAGAVARELVLEAVANKLGIEVSDDDIRAELREEGESDEDIEEFMAHGGPERIRPDLRLRKAMDRVAAEVTPIAPELAEARDSIWTPEKEAGAASGETKIWTPGS